MAKNGRSTTVTINPEADERLRTQPDWQRAADWAVIDRLRERNADKDPDEVLRDVTEVVEEVRQERYERDQQAANWKRGRANRSGR
jgi:hypothetical protein